MARAYQRVHQATAAVSHMSPTRLASNAATHVIMLRWHVLSLQEIMTDPSYKCQFVAFTCPHIGNVGINPGGPCAACPSKST